MLYNDAYASFLGRGKHPAMLARSAEEAWLEIWPTIGPMIERVRKTGQSCWSEDVLMFFDRELPKEEVYVTFSFSPVLGEGNEVDGVFCACTETTEKLIGSRRLETLRRLGICAAEAQTVARACKASAEVLAENPYDVPFAAIYVLDEARTRLTLCGSAGLKEPHPLPPSVSLASGEHSAWPLAAVLQNRHAEEVDLPRRGLLVPGGPWPEPADKAIVLPIPGAEHGGVIGLLITGTSPRRVLDAQYRSFFACVASHLGTAIAGARDHEAERRRAEALADLDRAKTTFFSNVSHEFRTPLSLVLAPLEDTLANLASWSPDAVRVQLETAHRNALRLLKLVNALLDFSRIEAGRVQASFEPVDLAALTSELASVFRAAIERAGLTFTVRCEPLSEPVYVDREMWEKIVLNLLSNAFKFTFAGAIEVTQRLVGDRIELTVRDTGIGVTAEELPRLFERFYRIEGAKARTHEGSGIGLSLVRELVRMHGGEIRADSELGKGTTFTVSLHRGAAHLPSERIGAARTLASTAPREAAFVAEALRWSPDAEDSAAQSAPASAAAADARILVADDNADMREYLSRLLGARWTVEAVADGAAALTAVRKGHFDLVLTDVMMPRLDGFGLLKQLRADPRHKAIPVIMLSARAGEESRIAGLESGADDYLIKPFSGRGVVARVETHLKLSARRALAAENAALRKLRAAESAFTERKIRAYQERIRQMAFDAVVNEERERRRIAADLHDGVGQSLALSQIKLTAIRKELSDTPRHAIDQVIALLQESIASTRTLTFDLSPPILYDLGFKEAVSWWAEKLEKSYDIRIAVEDDELDKPLDDMTAGLLFRATRELLMNVIKHSRSPTAKVSLRCAWSRFEVTVEDAGVGFDPDDLNRPARGFGLLSVREQISRLGGMVEVASTPGRGARIAISIPLRPGQSPSEES